MPGILMVLAHPDDESFVGGGTLHYYRQREIPNALICFTDGQSGRQGPGMEKAQTKEEQARIAPVRRREMQEAARILQIDPLITPGWMDGQLERVPDEKGIAVVVESIRKFRPEVLISFGPEGAPTAHPDHQATMRWASTAFDLAAAPGYQPDLGQAHQISKYYWITFPNEIARIRGALGAQITTVIKIGPEAEAAKRKAFAAHATQQDHIEVYNQLLEALAGREFFHLAKTSNEFHPSPETDLFEYSKEIE